MQLSALTLHQDPVLHGDEYELAGVDGDFIASCAGNAEAGWRSTKAAIKGLLLIEASETCADDAHGCNHPRDAFEILESILAEWPIENLTNNQ